MKKFFAFMLLTLCLSSHSQDVIATDNVIAMSYADMTVYQQIVLSATQKAGGTFTLSVKAKDGGGRGPPNFPSDKANLSIQYYNSSGTLLATSTSNNQTTYGETTYRTYTLTSTDCGGVGCSGVYFIRVQLTGNDGGFWAGNVGTNFMSPVLTFTPTGGTETPNLLYNPEFGVYGTYTSTSGPHGWWNTTNAWGGNTHPQVINNGSSVNPDAGGYLVQGGTLSGTVGGYVSTESALCCGGSSAAFNASAIDTAKVNTFVNRTTADSKVIIEQIGNSNTITVQQTGTNNNFAEYHGNGSSNNISITQNGNSSTQANYVDLTVTGNSNNVNITQNSTGGGKGAFVTVQDNNNAITLQQKDSGSHYASVHVSGGNKTVDILQQGSASHMANVTLSGNQTGLNLTQSGSTQQFYSINHNCSTSGGCGTITVQQGQ